MKSNLKDLRIFKECERVMRGRQFRLLPPQRFIFAPRLVKGRKSRFTKRSYMQEVQPDDPRFQSAPYEMGFVENKNVFKVEVNPAWKTPKKKKR